MLQQTVESITLIVMLTQLSKAHANLRQTCTKAARLAQIAQKTPVQIFLSTFAWLAAVLYCAMRRVLWRSLNLLLVYFGAIYHLCLKLVRFVLFLGGSTAQKRHTLPQYWALMRLSLR